jgi:hypothetical protein
VSRNGGGDRAVGGGDRSREIGGEKKLATARVCARGAREDARGPEELYPCSSRCWRHGGVRGSRGRARAGALRRGDRTSRPARGREGGSAAEG